MKRVLVVDDQACIRELVKQALDVWDDTMDIEEAEDGVEAVVNLECREYDLMICDVRMPQMDGFEVLRNVRERESTRTMPVIMLTAEDQPENIVGALQMGATAYVTKPFNVQDLMAALDAQKAYYESLQVEQPTTT